MSGFYATKYSTSQNGGTLTVGWNDAPAGQETTFHVTAAGDSGTYKVRMDVPIYWNANSQESVCDPSRGSWQTYTSLVPSIVLRKFSQPPVRLLLEQRRVQVSA